MSALVHLERQATGAPQGLLVLHHGRGADEHDLLGLADVLDPAGRLLVVTPRAPLTVRGWPGHHWYLVPRVGHPDPETFEASRLALAELHSELWERTGLSAAETILGGFSMGTVMSYALALSAERPAPAGVLAFSGFVPTVPGWDPSLADRPGLSAFIAHGRGDSVIPVQFARRAGEMLQAEGLPVDYHESDVEHRIDPRMLRPAERWVSATLR